MKTLEALKAIAEREIDAVLEGLLPPPPPEFKKWLTTAWLAGYVKAKEDVNRGSE